MEVNKILEVLSANSRIIELLIFLGIMLSSSARGAIATVSEILQKSQMTNEEALQKASDLMGKWVPYIPNFIRKWIIQKLFDSMKAKAVS